MAQTSSYRVSLAVVLATSVATIACGHPLEKKLEGRWFGESVEGFEDGDFAVATGWARGTSMEFSGSSITVTIPAEDPRSARYGVETAHGGEVVLTVARDEVIKERVRLTLDDQHLMRWHVDEDRSVVMRREH